MLNSALYYIGTAFRFYAKQPLLNSVVGVLLIVPYVLISTIDSIMQNYSDALQSVLQLGNIEINTVYIVVQILLGLWVLWGIASVITIGSKIIKNPAGRSKSSFQSVAKEAKTKILPLFFTGIIRDCTTLLLVLPYALGIFLYVLSRPTEEFNAFIAQIKSALFLQPNMAQIESNIGAVIVILLPLLFPAVYYRLKTSLYQIIVVHEDIAFRSALRKSSKYIHKKFWAVLVTVSTLSICTFIVMSALLSLFQHIVQTYDERLLLLLAPIQGVGIAFATALFTLSLIALLKDLLPTQ